MPVRMGRFVGGFCALLLVCALMIQVGDQHALAGSSWLSKARKVSNFTPAPFSIAAAGDSSTTVFDLVMSLYNDPAGDDDPNNDTGAEDQTNYENIIRFWADAVCEQSNQSLKLGKVRIFRNGIQGSLADVVWNASEWPRANASGFGVSGARITFGDVFPNGCGTGCDINFLNTAGRREDGGYTLGHEFGHYVLGVYDEYVGNDPAETRIQFPQTGDTAVSPSIMNSQWSATTATGNDFTWLNHSTQDNYEANTAQGRVFGTSAWEVLLQEVGDDPKDGDRASLSQRVRYTALAGSEPTAADNWVRVGLPGAQNDCRSDLEIIWMQDDIEMQLVIDRSGSMSGDPIANAKAAANILVDESENGKTALGVVSFAGTAEQSQPIIAVPDQDTKDDIKAVISGLSAGGSTAMFDAAKLAVDNLQTYATTNGTNAAQLVFLLSDGMDNNSTETQATVTAAYQAADVPLNTFAYGSFAPEGVLRALAEDTGGLFRASPTDLAAIQSAFLATKAALTSSAGIVKEETVVPAFGNSSIDFAVDSTMQEISIFANYAGTSGDVDFSLTGPNGAVSVSFACNDVSATTSCSAAVDEATVGSAGTGTWSLNAANNTGSPIDVNVDILASPKPVRTFDLTVASVGGSEVTYPNPIIVTATVSQGASITGVNIFATLTNPDGTTSPISLVDTGESGDGVAGDGTYSALVDYSMNGIHTITVKVNNAAQTASFTTEGLQPARARAPNEDGSFPVPPVLPPITENFTRVATMQVLVSGVVADDHPNTADGTTLPLDNSEVPGRIETSGDVDVLTTVSTTGFDSITIRVTGLAFGMEPRLRILAQDGSTEILSATINQLLEGADYLALAVPVGANAKLHAEVSHVTSGTGIYQVSAGNRIVSDPPLFKLDIKPDDVDNVLQPNDRGRIAVVILGTEIYDVTNVDVANLAFGPSGAPATHPRGGVFDDFNGDGLTDYLNHYSVREAGIAMGDTQACLSGTVAGVPFEACDMIQTVP